MTARTTQDTPDTATVLVVDDEPDNVDLLQVYLEAEGYQVMTAYRGEEALGNKRDSLINILDSMQDGVYMINQR